MKIKPLISTGCPEYGEGHGNFRGKRPPAEAKCDF